MSVTQKVTLYNNKFTVPPVINAVQNDTDRLIEAYFGDFTLQVGMTGVLSFIRSDLTHYEVSATLDTATNTATAELDQALTQAGVTQAQLKITDSGDVGSTFTFLIKVQPDVAGISVPQDGWSAQEFDQRLTDAENAIDAVEEDVEDLQEKKYDYAPVITDTASGSIATFPDGADSYPLKECVVNIEAVQSGSGDPSPDNVRPITGWSSAKVTRTGKNLLDPAKRTSENNGYRQRWYYNDGFILKANQAYTLSVTYSNSIALYIKDKVSGNDITTGNSPLTVTVAQDTLIYVQAYRAQDISALDTFQLELGSTATAYEPYNGQTVTIDLDGTRYGSTLDVRRGKLTVTHQTATYTSQSNFVEHSSGRFYLSELPSGIDSSRKTETICEIATYKDDQSAYGAYFAFGSVGVYFNKLNSADTLSDFKARLGSGVKIVYPLATPIEVDLSTTEITTLLGINNLWSDTGNIEVTYACDTKKYIQKLISQLA